MINSRYFLTLFELHGLGKWNRYELPSCVVLSILAKKSIRAASCAGTYSSISTDFKSADAENETLEGF